MAVVLQYRKIGGSAGRLTQTFLSGEIFFDTDVNGFFVGDSFTNGGLEVANALVTPFAVATQTIANGDAGKLFVYTNAAGCGVTLAQAGSSGGIYFPKQAGFWALNNSAGNVVITPTTSTINGASSLSLFPGDSAVIVSDGTNYFAILARTGFSAGTPVNIHVVGNTTGATSTSSVFITGSTITAAGQFSAGFSAGTMVFSNPNVNATEHDTALGNTTASTSATTQALGQWAISGAGDLSLGFSGSTLVLSAPAGATSLTGRNAVALGNTTGATSSSVLTLTQMSVQAGGGISVGFSTTGAGAGVMVVSGDLPATASTSNVSMFAIGNTTGSTSSQVGNITGQTFSVGGLLSAGFSNSTFVLSGNAGGSAVISYFEPRPLLSATSSAQLPVGSIAIIPLNLPAQLSFNRLKLLYSINVATLFGPIFLVQTTTNSDTLTASCSDGHTFLVANYSQVNATQFSSVTSTTVSSGWAASGSASRSSNSVSGTHTITFSCPIGTNITTFTTTQSVSSTSSISLGLGLNTITASLSGVFNWIIPLSTTMATGPNAIGIKHSSSTVQGSMSTGASYSAMPTEPYIPFFHFVGALGNIPVRTSIGAVGVVVGGRPWGAGFTTLAAGAMATTYNPTLLSTTVQAYGAYYCELFSGT